VSYPYDDQAYPRTPRVLALRAGHWTLLVVGKAAGKVMDVITRGWLLVVDLLTRRRKS
jgi:hypothetical protein